MCTNTRRCSLPVNRECDQIGSLSRRSADVRVRSVALLLFFRYHYLLLVAQLVTSWCVYCVYRQVVFVRCVTSSSRDRGSRSDEAKDVARLFAQRDFASFEVRIEPTSRLPTVPLPTRPVSSRHCTYVVCTLIYFRVCVRLSSSLTRK